MTYRLLLLCVLSIAFSGVLADATDGPRTGYFRMSATTAELLGADGANAIAEVLAPDEELRWQLYVPHSYDASKPAGVIVFINRWANSGGSRKSFNELLEEKNLIWIGPLAAGDESPINERMIRAMLAPNLLSRTYKLDASRLYVGGFSGGSHVASMLATSKPQMFRGGLFIGGGLGWKGKTPANIEQIRKNRYVFITGSNDLALNTVRLAAGDFREAGVKQTKVIVMPNARQEMPSPFDLRKAVEFLDGE